MHAWLTASQLAKRLEVSERTIRRDMEAPRHRGRAGRDVVTMHFDSEEVARIQLRGFGDAVEVIEGVTP